ncbi:MAG: hypothetical protein PHR35_17175 [Kiritimatiellae bacterium]|nr:hypothetical protein [Kiritimatiellia bacterium]
MKLELWDYLTIAAAVAWILSLLNRKRAVRKGARKIVEETKKRFAKRHEYRTVDPDDFQHLDLRFYNESKAAFEQHGFVHLRDEEDVTIKNASTDPRTFIRVMLSQGGTVTAAFYQPRVKLFTRLLLKVTGTKVGRTTDCESELSDGTFICTSNAVTASMISSPPQILTDYLPFESDPTQVLQRHEERLREHLAHHPELSVIPLRSVEDVHASQHRQEAIKATYRESVGWISKEELEKCADGDSALAADVHKEVSASNRQEQSNKPDARAGL